MSNMQADEVTAGTVIPADIQALFGKPPLLYNEDGALYQQLLSKIALVIEPRNAIEWFWVKDITDLQWEILRYRRIKALIIKDGTWGALVHLLTINRGNGQPSPEQKQVIENLSRAVIADDLVARDQAKALLERQGYDEDSVNASAFRIQIETLVPADRMIAAAELRRDRVLREIESHRATFGRRLREIVADAGNEPIRLPGPDDANRKPPLQESFGADH